MLLFPTASSSSHFQEQSARGHAPCRDWGKGGWAPVPRVFLLAFLKHECNNSNISSAIHNLPQLPCFFIGDRQLPQLLWLTFSAPSSKSYWVEYIHLCHTGPSLCFRGCLFPFHLQWYRGVAGRRQIRHWEPQCLGYHLLLGVSASHQHTKISEHCLQKASPGWWGGLHRPHHSSLPPAPTPSTLLPLTGTRDFAGSSLVSYWNSAVREMHFLLIITHIPFYSTTITAP